MKILDKNSLFQTHGPMQDANFSEAAGTQRIALHWVELPPQARSSYPHSESLEEEAVFIVKGHPHVWVNGYLYILEPGHIVGFPAGTGIAHTFINNTHETVEMIVLGERSKKESKYIYPLNPELQAQHEKFWWHQAPPHAMGPHDAQPGNQQHQRDWRELSFIRHVSESARKEFSYQGDTETFSLGVRLTDLVGLQILGLWHEVLPPQKRTSWPHAHKIEEEMILILKGSAQVWLNGEIHELGAGQAVFFPPGTNEAHTILNNSGEDVEFIGLGEATHFPDERIYYPLHESRNEQCLEKNSLWLDRPVRPLGRHPGLPEVRDVEISFEKNAQDFLQKTGPLLYQREAEYGLLLGLSELGSPGDYFTVRWQGQVVGGVLRSEKNLILSSLSEPLLPALAKTLQGVHLPGIVGNAMTAEAFARIWGGVRLAMAQKIYELTEVSFPQNVPGQLHVATAAEENLATQWLLEFSQEALPHEPTSFEKILPTVQKRISKNEIFLWKVQNSFVAMDLVSRPTRHGISVSGVYTPLALRGRGYASAIVAHTSHAMLQQGKKFCTLYTDSKNPTSNKIYQAIGYREIAASKHFVVEPRP